MKMVVKEQSMPVNYYFECILKQTTLFSGSNLNQTLNQEQDVRGKGSLSLIPEPFIVSTSQD